MEHIGLTLPERRAGSYFRKDFDGSLLQRKLHHASLFLSLSKKTCVFRDEAARALCPEKAAAYEKKVSEAVLDTGVLAEGTNEDVCRFVFSIRKECLGAAPFQNAYLQKGAVPAVSGIDQKKFAAPLLKKKAAVFLLTEPVFASSFVEAVKKSAKAGQEIFVLAFPGDVVLPDEKTVRSLLEGVCFTLISLSDCRGVPALERAEDPSLSRFVSSGDAALFAFGEEALVSVRSLALPAEIRVLPRGIPARALTGLFTRPAVSRLFAPAGFDPFPAVSLIRPTEVSYFQLAPLAEAHGETVYFLSPEKLRALDPGLFFSPYDDHLPPRREEAFSAALCPEEARRALLKEKIASLPGVRFLSGYFDPETFETRPVEWNAKEKQDRILADGVLIAPGTPTEIYPGRGSAISPRALFFDRTEKGSALVSNFAFFFTKKLAGAYDLLREDRPREQLSFPAGYVDYRRYIDPSGVRHESFPLYRKACLAGKEGGSYAAFSFELQGGTVTLGGHSFSWKKPNDPEEPSALFTPLFSEEDEGADPLFYKKEVGEGRLNAVFIGEKLLAVRRGPVLIPPMGVVLSLSEEKSAPLLPCLSPLENGYFDPAPLSVSVHLDPPDGFSREEWESFDWVYGGGLGLIDGEKEITRDNFESWCRREGWLTPLSSQTQESALHTLARHPRTGVGVTEKGELFILVFSGRSRLSLGADYVEMVQIARRLVPGIRFFINWDGGGSSLLALLEGDRLTEISLPSPSDESITGMARPIHSMIVIHPKEKK